MPELPEVPAIARQRRSETPGAPARGIARGAAGDVFQGATHAAAHSGGCVGLTPAVNPCGYPTPFLKGAAELLRQQRGAG
jgi:hypothetical protein